VGAQRIYAGGCAVSPDSRLQKKVRRVRWYPTQAKTGLEWGTQHPAGREGELQIPRLPPDFLSGLVVSVDFVRLSSKKAACVVVDESSVVGNPEFARDDKGEGGDSSLGAVRSDEQKETAGRSGRNDKFV